MSDRKARRRKGEDQNQGRAWNPSGGGAPGKSKGWVWVLLALSILANVWQGRALLRAPASSAGTAAVAGHAATGEREHDEAPLVLAPDEFRWSMVQSSDYARYLGNLRMIGCPPETSTNLVARLLFDDFSEAAWEMARPSRENFWRFRRNPDDPEAVLVKDSFSKLEAETTATGQRIFPGRSGGDFFRGGSFSFGGDELKDWDNGAEFDFLSAEKQKAVRPIVREGEKLVDSKTAGTVRPFAETMLEVLTPEEFEEYNGRHTRRWLIPSPAERIRNSLFGFPATPGELHALAKVMLDVENEQPFEYDESKYETVENKRLRNYLGEARFAEFKRGLEPGFRKFALLAEAYGAPAGAAAEIYEMEKQTDATARELLADPKATEGQKRGALADLRENLRRKVTTLFGTRALETWELNGGFKLPGLEGK